VLRTDTTSPVRQELDLRLLARDLGFRVVGVASDLNVSATKVPPWKREELGDWLNNRAPEFDVLLIWKLDRFVRRMSDLSTMIAWCLRYGKNLASKCERIDLTSETGRMMVEILGGVAEIEAAAGSTRTASLWDYTKTQSAWLVGKPSYGYVTGKDSSGKVVLRIDADAYRVLHWCRSAAMRRRPCSARRMAKVLVRSGLCGSGLTPSTLLRRLRNPALMGYRVEEDKKGGIRRSKLVLDRDGQPIKVAEGIFTEEEFDGLQRALDRNSRSQPARRPGGATKFIGVLICADCSTSMTVQKTTKKSVEYRYLRCRACRGGGYGAPNPDEVYSRLVAEVLAVLGDEPVRVREYARGTAGDDRWVNVQRDLTFRTRWEEGGIDTMAADLLRIGMKCKVKRDRVTGERAPRVRLELVIPPDARERLVINQDPFTEAS
jgi:DNA invertase Pin-like site-specific DNA recombinase